MSMDMGMGNDERESGEQRREPMPFCRLLNLTQFSGKECKCKFSRTTTKKCNDDEDGDENDYPKKRGKNKEREI